MSLRRPNHLQTADVDFNSSRDQLAIARGLRSQGNGAGNQHDRLGTEPCRSLHHLRRGPLRVERELHQPCAIPQIDEDESSEIPPAMHPAAEPHLLPELLAGQRASAVGPQRRRAHQACSSASSRTAYNWSAVSASQSCWRRWSLRTSRAIRLRIFTCCPAVVSGPTIRKKRRTGSPSMES